MPTSLSTGGVRAVVGLVVAPTAVAGYKRRSMAVTDGSIVVRIATRIRYIYPACGTTFASARLDDARTPLPTVAYASVERASASSVRNISHDGVFTL